MTSALVTERMARGQISDVPARSSHSAAAVVRANVCTRFNAIMFSSPISSARLWLVELDTSRSTRQSTAEVTDLTKAIAEERYEFQTMYPPLAERAKAVSDNQAATRFSTTPRTRPTPRSSSNMPRTGCGSQTSDARPVVSVLRSCTPGRAAVTRL
ncbi:hypothetical protein GCM10029978_075210 [Actinoallomurus acanthiterrae]